MKHLVFIEAGRPLQSALEIHYSPWLVALSLAIAIMAAYTGFLLSERVRAAKSRPAKTIWLLAGAAALGGGVWAMHFFGMLALNMPVAVTYDVRITLLSMLPAFLASLVVLMSCCTDKYHTWRWLLRGILMGSGVGLMHYTGMAAMHMAAVMRYDPLIFSLSIVVAITLSLLSLRFKQWADSGNLGSLTPNQASFVAAVIMGCAISAMHYTGMAAAHFFPAAAETPSSLHWEPHSLALVISLLLGVVLLLLISAVFIHRRLGLMEQLQSSKNQLHAIFDTIQDGIITIDEQGKIRSFNHAAEKIFAYEANEVIGHNVSLLMPEPTAQHHDGYLHHYLDSGDEQIIGIGREVQGLRKDGSLFPMELTVSEAGVEGKVLFTGVVRDISQRKQAEDAIKIQQQQITIVRRAQASFIASNDPVKFFEGMLPDVLALTQSEFGLIGEAMQDEQGQCYLKAYAVSNIAWDEATRRLYKENAPQGLEFRNIDNLFSKVITEGEVIISNDPAHDPRSAGIPENHPPLYAFLGVPIYLSDQLLGMIGVANRPGGYDETVVERLQPILTTCAQLLAALGKERDKKQVAKELKRTNSFMAALIENLQAGLLVEDEAGEIFAVNQTYCDMFLRDEMPLMLEGNDCTQEFECIKQLFAEPDAFLQRRQECLDTPGVVSGIELALLDGRIFELDCVPILMEDEQGQLHRNHLWSFHDISEHKHIEAQLRQQGQELEQAKQDEHALSELLKLALQSSSMKVFLDFCLQTLLYTVPWLRLNPRGAVFLTTKKGDGQALHLTVEHDLDRELHSLCARVPFGTCLCGRAAAERAIHFVSCVDERHDNGYEGMPAHGHYNLPLIQDDKVLGVMVLYLTHGHETSSQELDFLEQVSEIIAMGISRRYASRALLEAKEQAEAAAKAKSLFLATMSHEIRTPMNGVLGMLHLLGKTPLSVKQQHFVNTATGSGEMLLTVINDILDFSKLEAGKLELESIFFDPLELVEDSVILMAKGAHEKGLELICWADESVPRQVRGDPTRLRQILINLISNAIKFTERGDVVVYASATDENCVHFGVRDTGIGITPEQQTRLFQSFSQVDSSHTRKYGGTGLGLIICQRLVEAMGGKIRVASAPGLGTEFSVEIPLETIAGTTLKKHKQVSHRLPKQRILVVDDNLTNRDVLTNILAGWQITNCGEAEHGADAMAQLRAAAAQGQPYDIALLDMQMPEMTGLELARAIRQDPILQHMHLMMLSSVDRSEPAPELECWMSKPVRQSDLYNNLLMILGETVPDQPKPAGSAEGETWWFGGRKLLLVEDNHVNQEVAREILGEAGFDIDIRENGTEGVQAVQEHSYDVVLMDIQMPVMDGLEATRQIRSLGRRFTELPIIAMTAHALSGDSDKSLAAGMNGHVTKPIDPEVVFKTLAQWVEPGNRQGVTAKTVEAVDIAEEMPHLPGIDMIDGLDRLRGNWSAYRRILLSFADKQADAADRLEQFIEQDDWEEAARLAHTLKGSSGNLGAKHLYTASAALEQSCRRADGSAALTDLEALRTSLSVVIKGLAQLAEQPSTSVNRPATEPLPDAQAVDALLEKLVQLLDSDLGEAQACIIRLREQVTDSDYLGPVNELEKALNNFDIEAAKAIGQRMIKHS
ncbi:MAG TPA: response regulator [Gammaproteobacteria bacterium]|nr:response regulator [Gammaproteobacteria bacterium]